MENVTQLTRNKHYVNGVHLAVVEAGPADGPLVILLHRSEPVARLARWRVSAAYDHLGLGASI